MQQRLIGAAVLVPVVVIAFLLGQPWLTFFIAALAAGAAWETARLVRLAGLNSEPLIAVVLAPAAVIGMWRLSGNPNLGLAGLAATSFIALVVIVSAIAAFREKDPREGFKAWVGTVIATLYPSLLAFLVGVLVISYPVSSTYPLGGWIDDGRAWLLVLLLTVWALDTFAYVAGKYHGRGRFMNHISPNKTWSGAIGGATAAVVVCAALTAILGQSPMYGALLGLAIGVVAQAGDLTESLLKRAAGEKDSGTLLPGHGGFLDRLDSFLFAGPVMFVFVALSAYFFPQTFVAL